MSRYKWASASEWLEEKISGCQDLAALDKLAMALLRMVDNDQIQDTFQGEMDADGFFEDLDAPAEPNDEGEDESDDQG